MWNNSHFQMFSILVQADQLHLQDFLHTLFVPFTCKKGLIKTLINQIFRLINTWNGFHLDLEKLSVILQKKRNI